MNRTCRTHRIARPTAILASLASALAAVIAAAPAALATPRPRPPGWNKHPPLPASLKAALRFPPGWNKHPPLPAHTHALVTGSMPGWQITLLAAAAVLLAVALAALATRIRATRRHLPARTT